MIPERVRQLSEEWQRLAATMRGYGADAQAMAIARCAEDLTHMVQADETTVTLTEAARISGYSADYLGKLVKRGVIPNRGKLHAPRINLGDVPRKATARRAPAPEPALPAGLEARLAG